MYFASVDELKKYEPYINDIWDKEKMYEFLVCYCNIRFEKYIFEYFQDYLEDENLADMLFSFLLDDNYEGSDSQMGAASVISIMDKKVLKKKKDKLLAAQKNEVDARRPFPFDDKLEWLD